MRDLLATSTKLVEEGSFLLAETGILSVLEKYGEVKINGSYAYNVMIERDIDIVITTENMLTATTRNALLQDLASLKDCISIKMVDRQLHPKRGRPKGFWIMPELKLEDHIWSVDVWLIQSNELSLIQDANLDNLMRSINDNIKEVILKRKSESLNNGNKKKGITSVQIYREVLGIS